MFIMTLDVLVDSCRFKFCFCNDFVPIVMKLVMGFTHLTVNEDKKKIKKL